MVYTFFIGGGSRISERSITQGALEEGAKRKIELISSGTNSTIARALHNKYQVVVQRFVTNYFQYFSPKFLFTRGSSDSYYGMFPGIGTIYLFDGLMLLGVVPYLLKKNPKKPFFAVLAWLLIAPLPAALSTGAGYSGNRAMGMVPALQLIEIFGLVGWISIFSKLSRKITYLILFIVATLLVWNVFQFGKLYLKQIPQSSYREMGDGNLEVARWVESESKDKKVIISRSFGEPQIFFAFSEVWNPKEYQEYSKEWKIDDAKVNWVDQLPEYKLGKYTIKSVDWEKDTKKDVMIVARPDDFPKSDIPDKIFYYSNGVPSMYVKNY